jgi:arylsulfatase A-like enzyme
MFERGISGHTTPLLYEPLLHVPLIISRPEQSQRQDITTLTSCLDILPTIASLTGQDIPPWAGGRVLPGFDGYEEKSDRTVFALEAKSSPKFGPLKKATITAIRDQYKLIDYRGYPASPAMELFDLTKDPEELHNLASDQPSLVNELKQEINSAIGW